MTNEVDPTGLAHRLMQLLKIGLGCEVELSLLRNGSVLVTKCQEDGIVDAAAKVGEGRPVTTT